LSEHGDIIETQTIILYLCDMHNNMHCISRKLCPLQAFLKNFVTGWW